MELLTLLKAPFPADSLSWRIGNKSNWDKVNKIKREWQKKSLKFLTDNL